MRNRAVLAGLATLGLASGQQNTVIQTETRVVLVDAIVTGKSGAYVNDLTQNEFRVFQDNKEQAIKSFSLETATKAAEPRSLVLFFDESSMEVHEQVLVRQAASRFIDAETGPNRRIAVVSYDGSLRVNQTFTDNAGRLKDALPAPRSNLIPDDPIKSGLPVSIPKGANSDFGARNMIRALGDLGRSLGALPGRKIVVLFSGAVASSSDQRNAVREAVEACNRSGVAIYPADVRSVAAQTDQGDTPALPADRHPEDRRNSGGFGRAQPHGDSDTFGEAQNLGAGSQQIIFGLATGTGGFVIRNSNDLLAGLQSIAAEQDEYYALTFTPPESPEGSCHALRVKVDRKGTSVRARTSYCTVKPVDLLAGTSTGKELETQASAAQAGTISASMELPYFYLPPGIARVNLAMEIAPDAVKFENQKGKLHAEINLLGIASKPDGGVAARFSDALRFDFENRAEIEKWKAKPLHYEKEFKIAPGAYRFTMVFNSGAASFGKIEAPLVVDAPKAGEPSLGSLVLSQELRPAAADLGLGLDLGLTGDRTALITEGMQVIPSGSNQLTQAQPAYLYFEVYPPSAVPTAVRVRILDQRTGEQKWDSGPSRLTKAQQGGPIPLNLLTPGEYQLEVSVGDLAGKPAKRTADFVLK
ncbi:MAG TPA: VWA domain-containing protein [Bryobacteraceae bacterium]|nr:VWA domain-containing protein [Bryobacteraceae bacterium]